MHSGVVVVSVGAVHLSCGTGCQYQWRRMVPSTCPTGLDGVPDRSTSGFLAGRVGERTESKKKYIIKPVNIRSLFYKHSRISRSWIKRSVESQKGMIKKDARHHIYPMGPPKPTFY